MENQRERTTVDQQAHALNTTSACPNVTRRQMLAAFATTGIALAQLPMIAPVAAQASTEVLPALPIFILKVKDFIQSLVQIPAAPVNFSKFKNPTTGQPLKLENTTTSTVYIAGISDMYAIDPNTGSIGGPVGRCSASFLCFQVPSGDPNSPDPHHPRIFTDIANYISLDNGLIVSWFTPATLSDLGLDTIIHKMVTECIVVASTKIGVNPFFGETFNLKVSSVSVGSVETGDLEERVQFVFTNITT